MEEEKTTEPTVDDILQSLGDPCHDVKISSTQLADAVLSKLEEAWLLPDGVTNNEAREHSYQRYKVSMNDVILNKALVQQTYNFHRYHIWRMYKVFMDLNMIGDELQAEIENQRRFSRLFEANYMAREQIENDFRTRSVYDRTDYSNVSAEFSMYKYSNVKIEETKPFQRLVLFIYRELYKRGYKKVGVECVEQIVSPPDLNGKPHPTRAWKPVCTIFDFVKNTVQKDTYYEHWHTSTEGNNRKKLVELLETAEDKEFPTLKISYDLRSFRNGIFDCRRLEFYPYTQVPVGIEDASCNYYDLEFDPMWLEQDDFLNIPTAHFTKIPRHQDFDELKERWTWALIGRLLFRVNERDNWQVIPFLTGVAGSGKSIIASVVQAFYRDPEVGTISNNAEKTFGLWNYYDKRVAICPDLKEDFSLDQANFLSMVTGETISVPIKYTKATNVSKWKVPLLLVGNAPPRWPDTNGQITRRMVPLEFLKHVLESKGDPNLKAKIDEEMGAILCKAAMAYDSAVQAHGGRIIWDVLPPSILSARQRLRCRVNPIVAFLEQSGKVVFGPELNTPFKDLSVALEQHCKSTHTNMVPFTKEYYSAPFQERGIDEAYGDDVLLPNGKMFSGRYFSGVGLKDED